MTNVNLGSTSYSRRYVSEDGYILGFDAVNTDIFVPRFQSSLQPTKVLDHRDDENDGTLRQSTSL